MKMRGWHSISASEWMCESPPPISDPSLITPPPRSKIHAYSFAYFYCFRFLFSPSVNLFHWSIMPWLSVRRPHGSSFGLLMFRGCWRVGKVYATRLAKACVKGELDQSPTHPAPHRNRSGGRNFGVKKEMRPKMGGELRRLRKARSDPIKPQLVLLDLSLRKKGGNRRQRLRIHSKAARVGSKRKRGFGIGASTNLMKE